ncbi:hypothetical protein FNV43_RR08394 [Rhamnella rubrinervis]|uniref:Uncharacterized protein n=1 Tax=Rhamnella rubrinervis TaxID=2594499 RepID=A0A8K0H842_9ROSA|nr:hypothetical protein FNV43_RR08394 [Rhamnella rubrinervis]
MVALGEECPKRNALTPCLTRRKHPCEEEARAIPNWFLQLLNTLHLNPVRHPTKDRSHMRGGAYKREGSQPWWTASHNFIKREDHEAWLKLRRARRLKAVNRGKTIGWYIREAIQWHSSSSLHAMCIMEGGGEHFRRYQRHGQGLLRGQRRHTGKGAFANGEVDPSSRQVRYKHYGYQRGSGRIELASTSELEENVQRTWSMMPKRHRSSVVGSKMEPI